MKIIKEKLPSEDLMWVNLTKEVGRTYIIANFCKKTDAKGKKFGTTLYDIVLYNKETDSFVKAFTFFPKSLETRLSNLVKNNELGPSDAVSVRYLGKTDSNMGRPMHSFFVKVLKGVVQKI